MFNMRMVYFSRSFLPSQNANSINVIHMCDALSNYTEKLTLYCFKGQEEDINKYYKTGGKVNIRFYKRGIFSSALTMLKRILNNNFEVLYTRWLAGAFFFSVFLKKTIIIENHTLYKRKIDKWMYRYIAKKNNVISIFISKALLLDYKQSYNISKSLVLHDASIDKGYTKKMINSNRFKNLACGYVGSFKKGKGVETVLEVAKILRKVKFVIVGGTESEIDNYKKKYELDNVVFYKYISYSAAMDVLNNQINIALLPNYPNVMVGEKNDLDIGKWTSPLKLFDYMSYAKVIVSSDLPVLREVLTDNITAKLVEYNNINSWVEAIVSILNNEQMYNRLRTNALKLFKSKYTWDARARAVIECIGKQY